MRVEPNAMGGSLLESLWRLIAQFATEPAERVRRAREVLEEVDATLARVPAAARGEDVVSAAQVRGGYLAGARALLAIDPSYWALNEFSDRWLREYLENPEGPERCTLAALREAIAFVTGRMPVALVAPDSDAPEKRNTSPADVALVFEPGAPDTQPRDISTTAGAPNTGRLRLSSRRRWEEIERLARGEAAGFREAAERLLEEPGLGLIQFAVTAAGTAVFVAAHGAELGTAGLPDLAGWGEPAVFTSVEITAGWLAAALSGQTPTSWMTAYNRRGEHRQRWQDATDALLGKLYAALFAAPREWLRARSVERLLVVPHRGLHQLPLGAWFTQPARSRRRYVIDEFDLCFSPSLSLHEVCARRAPEAGRTVDRVLVVAPPGRGLALSGVDALALPGDARTLRGEDASAEEWSRAAGDADLCHYQGHAAYRWEQPLESELMLAGAPMTLGDLFDDGLEMPHVHAVTLSGCETTMTALDPADEWLGLAAGFMFAGAPAVLSTHWAVLELAASMLVERYYRELRAGRRPSAALGAAQRWLRDDVTRRDCRRFVQRVTAAVEEREGGRRERLLEGLPGGRDRPFAAPVWWGAHTVTGLDRPLRWSRGSG
jgi:CHAT domain-containing protein